MKAARPVPRSEETPEFREFWEVVWLPHMNKFDGRGDARKWFFHHVREHGADPRDMVDGARWFIYDGGNQSIGRDGKPVRIHAGSWLNKFAYEDAADRWRAYQARMAERTIPQPTPKPEPTIASMTKEEREAAMRRIYERNGLRPPGELH